MVSGTKALAAGNSGIYTPLLAINGSLNLSFDYVFSENFTAGTSRWLKICLANAKNEIVYVLENISFNAPAGIVQHYLTNYKNIPAGEFRMVLLYGGKGGDTRLALDNLITDAPYVYNEGCKPAPLAIQDNIKGWNDRSAAGSVIANDLHTNKAALRAFLVNNSTDGTVVLQPDGSFTFAPHPSFHGRTTSFQYRICDESGAGLCSGPATVQIVFTDAPPENQLVDFKGSYKSGGEVELAWNTGNSTGLEKFEIDRSFNGHKWETSGTVHAASYAANGQAYTFTDKMKKNTVLKNDVYYRLRQFRADGTVATSRLMIVRVYNTQTLTMISVTPNPVKKDIAVNLQLQEASYVSMRMLNKSSETVLHQTVEAEKGTSNLLVEHSSDLQPGDYQLEVIVNSKERMIVKLQKD